MKASLCHESTIDAFAGGGGASTGIEQAYAELGLDEVVDVAVNHDDDALAMHAANHPRTLHLREDVFKVDVRKVVGKRLVRLLWLSPDCKHFSKAKGGKPVEKRIRGLAWVAVKWAKILKPRAIVLENVEEFQDWGPLVKTADGWFPDASRKGQTFQRFIGQLRAIGYKIEWRELRACDYGAPTIRKRLFVVCRRDKAAIVWPKPSHGKGLTPYRTAAECIDWSVPCPSIFERQRPLAEATLRRIARGIQRYVIDAAEPFIVPVTHHGDDRVHPTTEPMRTVTSARRGEFALVSPTLIQTGYGERPGQAPRVPGLHKPIGTLVDGGKHALVSAFLAQHNAGFYEGKGRDVRQPMSTVMQSGSHQSVVTAHIAQFNGDRGKATRAGRPANAPLSTIVHRGTQQRVITSHLLKLKGTCKDGQPVTEPMPTVQAGGLHTGEVRAFLVKYYGNEREGVPLSEPMHTVTAKDRLGLVTIHGQPYQIVDIGMRMLTARELARAQGFPDSYVIDRGADGSPLTKSAQVRMIGNSVCPPLAKAIVMAQFAAESAVARPRRRAA